MDFENLFSPTFSEFEIIFENDFLELFKESKHKGELHLELVQNFDVTVFGVEGLDKMFEIILIVLGTDMLRFD